jgi:5-methylcytosine-specific restriction endonuclease McrA
MPTHSLDFDYGDKTIQEFVLLFKNAQLNLEPGFQRDSVWTLSDRKKLIESLLQNYPIPSVFLYRQSENGKLRYDVIDGKQRLETILMFQGAAGFYGHRFAVKLRLGPDQEIEEWDWQRIRKRGHEHRLMGYKFQTVEITGDLSDIIDLFVRINSTGKRLTGAEKRHAKFFRSDFLKQAGRLAESRHRFFLENRILSAGQISRMKHVELICELMASIQAKGLINKKKALDGIIGGQSADSRTLRRIIQETIRILNLVRKMFPDIRMTRFANSADFYSLFVFIWELDRDKCILSDAKRNKQARKLLVWLSNGVGIVRQQQRKAEGANPDQRIFADYQLTVQGDTDSLATRQRRGEILKKVLGGLFEKKDEHRGFTVEQRRLLWHSDERRKCPICRKPLSWSNFTIDHIKPYALGGKSTLSNAALMCRSCNSRKGKK